MHLDFKIMIIILSIVCNCQIYIHFKSKIQDKKKNYFHILIIYGFYSRSTVVVYLDN